MVRKKKKASKWKKKMWTKLEVIKLKNTGELKGGLSSRMTEPQNASLLENKK